MDPIIYLFSPIVPQKTGTADYFESVVLALAMTRVDRRRFVIVVDDLLHDFAKHGNSYYGFSVISYHALPHDHNMEYRYVVFLANNDFHCFCFEFLSRLDADTENVICVIHEPSCFMILQHMCLHGIYGFDNRRLEDLGSVQFGSQASKVISSLQSAQLPTMAPYVMHFQSLALTRSREIWCHSTYAALKLTLESNIRPEIFPKLKIVKHPELEVSSRRYTPPVPAGGLSKSAPQDFVIGVFGWVAPSKRVLEIIEGYALFRNMLGGGTALRPRLLIVGQLPPKDYYDPIKRAEESGFSDSIQFLDYVEIAEFNRLISTCRLIFNLRFPSCGETSGTLKRAAQLGIPVYTSAYQAFHEEPSKTRISTLPIREVMEIANAMYEHTEETGDLVAVEQKAIDSMPKPARYDITTLLLKQLDEITALSQA